MSISSNVKKNFDQEESQSEILIILADGRNDQIEGYNFHKAE